MSSRGPEVKTSDRDWQSTIGHQPASAYRDGYFNLRALAGAGVDAHLAAHRARAFGDVRKAKATTFKMWAPVRGKTAAIIAHREMKGARFAPQHNRSGLRLGMLRDVVQAFLDDAVKINLELGRQGVVDVVEGRPDFHSGGIADLAGHRGDGFGQPKLVDLERPQVLRDLAHFAQSGGGHGR